MLLSDLKCGSWYNGANYYYILSYNVITLCYYIHKITDSFIWLLHVSIPGQTVNNIHAK